MSAGPATTLRDTEAGAPHIAASAVIVGTARLGEGSLLAEGAVIRSDSAVVQIGTRSALLENSVVVGTRMIPTTIGRRTTFGHRCIVIGATVGDLCEIGNASKLMLGARLGARLGDRVFLGEGTLVPAGMTLPSDVVAVGRPARIIRTASADDLARLLTLREGDLSVPPPTAITVEDTQETITMGQLYEFRGIVPTIAASAAVFPTAEITGDVVVGERTIIGAGVKIIGDSHGPVRIGNDVQILENTVLHLPPDNDLIIDDGVIAAGAMIHGCRIGTGTVIEPGAIVCDGSELGAGCVVRAGSVVKQRSRFAAGTDIDGFPAVDRTDPMNTKRHVAHARASSGSTKPAYRVDLRAGTHQLVADEPAATGGGDLGPSPFELLLSALAACTATTLRMYADRHDWALPSLDVGVRYDLDDEGRGAVERMITVPVDLTPEQRHRLAEIAERTPVTLAVRAGTPITTRLRENQTTRASI